jgi:hypothetical protein
LRSLTAGAVEPVRHGMRRRVAGAIVVSLLATVALIGVGAPAASAAPEAGPGWAFKGNFGEVNTYGGAPTPVAVDGSGNIFGTLFGGTVKIYSPSSDGGTLLTEFSTPFLLGRSIAVDPNDGTIYADGAFGQPVVRLVSDGAPTPTYTVDPTFEIPPGEVTIEGLAVDPTTGDLLIADPGAEGVRRYDSSGTLLETIATPSIGPALIAAAPDGSFYVASGAGPDISHFSGAGTLLGTISGVGSLHGLAYDASRSLIVAAVGELLKSYSSAGALLSESPSQGGGGIGLAVSPSGTLYEHTGGSLNYYAPGTAPDTEAPQVSAITATSANVSAEVDPGAGPPEGSVAHFEVSADGGLTWPEELKTADVPVERTVTGGPDTIEADLTGLEANSDYLVRVVAANGEPISSTSAATPFHTLLGPPEVETGPAISITDTSAELTGTIDTLGGQTTYHFEYGLTAAYGSRVPVDGEAPAGTSRTPRPVSRPISGLQPNTTYHFRLVAQNAAGTTEGPDRTFVTAAVAPPVRGYEQVTPVDKKGGVINSLLGFQAAADGSAVSYTLAAAPADAPSAVIFTRYLSRRGSTDWLNWSPTDPPVNVPRGIIEVVTQAISSDFTHALVVSNRALTPGAENGSANIYVEDLRTRDYTLVGTAPGWSAYLAMAGIQTENQFLAAAPDFSWITFISPRSLLPGAPREAMYRWSLDEGLTLQSSGTASIRRPDAGNELTARHVSDDGDVMYYDLTEGDGGVYRHVLGGATTPVSVAEEGGDLLPGKVASARLEGVSRDGRYAIFRTQQRLTEDNPTSSNNAWMYRFDAQTGDVELIGQPVSTTSGAVYAVGDDGMTMTIFYHGDLGGSFSWRDGVTHKFTDAELDFSLVGGVQHFISPDGRYLAYVDSGAVHLYDSEDQTDVCVSCPSDGSSGGRDFGLPLGTRTVSNRTPEVVNNSGLMFFDTAARLVSADHNGSRDVYSYKDGELTLISPGDGNFTARFGDATPDGSVVYFTTNQSLVGRDTDGQIDVYASRIGPVFDQSARPSARCAGETCQSPITSPPSAPNVGSNARKGAGDPDKATISRVRKLSSSGLSTLAKGGKARLKLTVSDPGKVSVTGKARVGKKSRQVVSAFAKAPKAGPVSVSFGLSKAGLSALKSQGSLTVSLTVRFKDASPKVVTFTLRAATSRKGGRS